MITSVAGRILLPALVFTYAALSAERAVAQTTDSTFEEAIDVHEVLLTVRATTWRGKPIDGLTAADFSVTEDGKPVEIVGFRRLDADGGRAGPVPQEPVATNSEAGPALQEEQELVVLLFDMQGLQPRRARALQQLLEWVDAHPQEIQRRNWLVAILDGSIGLVSDPTNDPSELRNAVAAAGDRRTRDRIWRFVESPAEATWVQDARAYNAAASSGATPLGDEVSERMLARQKCFGKRDWMTAQIDALQQLIESLAPIPGRKSIVWIHSSHLGDVPEYCQDWEIFRITRAMQDLGALTAASGVILHAANLEGLNLEYGRAERMNMGVSENNMASPAVLPGHPHNMSLGTLARNMAGYTGGRRIESNTPPVILDMAFAGPVYEIAVRVPHGRDGKEHRFHVDLRGHTGADLYYQRSWLDLSKRDLLVNQLRRLSLLPGSYGAFPVALRGQVQPESSALEVSVAVPVNRVGLVERKEKLVAQLEPYVAVHRLDGTLVVFQPLDASPLELPKDAEIGSGAALKASVELELPPGEYMVTGAFFDALNETAGLTSTRMELPGNTAELDELAVAESH